MHDKHDIKTLSWDDIIMEFKLVLVWLMYWVFVYLLWLHINFTMYLYLLPIPAVFDSPPPPPFFFSVCVCLSLSLQRTYTLAWRYWSVLTQFDNPLLFPLSDRDLVCVHSTDNSIIYYCRPFLLISHLTLTCDSAKHLRLPGYSHYLPTHLLLIGSVERLRVYYAVYLSLHLDS